MHDTCAHMLRLGKAIQSLLRLALRPLLCENVSHAPLTSDAILDKSSEAYYMMRNQDIMQTRMLFVS